MTIPEVPKKRRCKNCPRFFLVNPSRPDEKKFCSPACRQEYTRYGANDMVHQRDYIERRIRYEMVQLRTEIRRMIDLKSNHW